MDTLSRVVVAGHNCPDICWTKSTLSGQSFFESSSVQQTFPHGNAKDEKLKKKNFLPTRHSIREELKNEIGDPSLIYKKRVQEGPDDVRESAVVVPRNVKEVKNFQYSAQNNAVPERDPYYRTLELALAYREQMRAEIRDETKSFIRAIVSFPERQIVLASENMLEKVRRQLMRPDIPDSPFYYDCTYNNGDELMSLLVTKMMEYFEAPALIVMAYLHARRTTDTHRYFWKKVHEYLPELKSSKNAFLVTDEEEAIVNATENEMSIPYYRCVVHVWKNAKLKLTALNITGKELTQRYKADIYRLIYQDSYQSYSTESNKILLQPDYWHKVSDLFVVVKLM